jgi:hypothetical protein
LAGGCTRTPPYLQPIEAETPMELNLWRSRVNQALTPEEWRWFETVLQEYRFQLMREGKASGSKAVDEALRQTIHGRPLAEVMREGLQMHLRRKTGERDEMKIAFERNEQKRRLVRAGDADTLSALEHHQKTLAEKLARNESEITAAQAAFAAFEAKAGR